MPLDYNFDFEFSEEQKAAIHTGLDMVLGAFTEASTPRVNLTAKERQKTPSIGATRMPYVRSAVHDILPVFPKLESSSIPLDRSTRLFNFMLFMQGIAPKITVIQKNATDMGINVEHLLYKSMTDSYNTAKQQEGRIPGADVLLKSLAPLFAKTKNPTVQKSDTDSED